MQDAVPGGYSEEGCGRSQERSVCAEGEKGCSRGLLRLLFFLANRVAGISLRVLCALALCSRSVLSLCALCSLVLCLLALSD